MIRKCGLADTGRIYFIINESARAYEGVIPADCYHQPYMPAEELEREMRRIDFYGFILSGFTVNGWQADGELVGVMGLEPVKDVTLIRHAYILPEWQKQGIGSRLLDHITGKVATNRLLVGTWADARWAIDFYRKHGFTLLPDKDKLLNSYWEISQRQVETSVVLGQDIKGAVAKE